MDTLWKGNAFCGTNVLYLQLNFSPFVGVFFYGVTDVECVLRFDVACLRTLAERNAVHNVVRLVVYQFEFNVFLVAAYYFAGAVVVHFVCVERGFLVARPKRAEALQVVKETMLELARLICAVRQIPQTVV